MKSEASKKEFDNFMTRFWKKIDEMKEKEKQKAAAAALEKKRPRKFVLDFSYNLKTRTKVNECLANGVRSLAHSLVKCLIFIFAMRSLH